MVNGGVEAGSEEPQGRSLPVRTWYDPETEETALLLKMWWNRNKLF